MELTLIPVCSERDHVLGYKYKSHDVHCDLCNKGGISYQCSNCDYKICSKCQRSLIKSDSKIKQSMKGKLSSRIKDEQEKLNEDGLSLWIVELSKETGELYYYNIETRSISYDYPKLFRIPPTSPLFTPETELNKSVEADDGYTEPNEPEEYLITSQAHRLFTCMRQKVSQLNLY